MQRQVVLSAADLAERKCPRCGAHLEVISGHWLLRDCALCAWCRSWFALPEQDGGVQTWSFNRELPGAEQKKGN